jgi:AbiU2
MMLNSKTDTKNIHLLKLLAQLRDHIDMHRIIGLNVAELQESHISGALLGYLQKSAHESLALYFSKIFEASSRNDLNSLPGIIESIPMAPLTEIQKQKLAAFGSKYSYDAIPADARSYLRDAFVRFRDAHSQPIDRLKEFRDTIGAHSDYRANITSLPSHAEFETLFGFARDFYEVVADSIIGIGPAMIPRAVGHGFVRLIGVLGVTDPKFDFENDR